MLDLTISYYLISLFIWSPMMRGSKSIIDNRYFPICQIKSNIKTVIFICSKCGTKDETDHNSITHFVVRLQYANLVFVETNQEKIISA